MVMEVRIGKKRGLFCEYSNSTTQILPPSSIRRLPAFIHAAAL
jgi:hypothetical protein